MFAGAVAVGDSHFAVAGLDGTIAFLSLEDGALSASWETPSRRASKDRFFDGEGNIDYSGIKSLEDLHGHYNDFLTHLGGISGQMFSDGEVVYFASGDGSIGAVKMVRQ
jgi:hypothetical protein